MGIMVSVMDKALVGGWRDVCSAGMDFVAGVGGLDVGCIMDGKGCGASSRGGDLVVKLFVEIGMEGMAGTGGDGQE
ncbi:hypothetical protein D5086_017460 [Populus alba]|uniref:Uncharacterized protein n=1 Tax=Populus alba TaxID=43335 RepID=A0ACC4BMP6_POPAL